MGRRKRAFAHDSFEFLAFAEELMDAARHCRQTGRPRAGALLAVHASIAASDAVCVLRLGERASGEQHGEAPDLLATSGAPDAREKAIQFAAILAMKNRVAYEARPPTHEEGDLLVKRAKRLVDWAATVVRRAPPGS